MSVSKGKFPDSLDPVFAAIMKEPFEGEAPDIRNELFGVEKSTKSEERVSSISGLPKPSRFTGTLSYSSPDQGFDVTATHVTVAMGVQITREMWDDDQHGEIHDIFSGFRDAFHEGRMDDAADILNQSFTANPLDFYNHTENVALCSNSHTTPSSGVSTSSGFDNLSTAALSATALAADRYTMRLFNNFKGFPIDKVPNLLIVPVELEDEALKIVQTRAGLDTAAGDANIQAGRYRVFGSTRFSDSNNWWTANRELLKKSLRWYERVPFETDRMESFDQFNFKGRGYERYSYLWLFWQALLGHQVS